MFLRPTKTHRDHPAEIRRLFGNISAEVFTDGSVVSRRRVSITGVKKVATSSQQPRNHHKHHKCFYSSGCATVTENAGFKTHDESN